MDLDDPIFRFRDRPRLRLGIMGGAFDPIHVAHLVTAEEALHQFDLDEVLFMPSGVPPHKYRQLAPAEFRYMLTYVATAGHPRFWVSRYEIDRDEVGYTIGTLRFLVETLAPDAQLFFITGADAVLDILTWKDPEQVLELCTLIAATRPGYDLARLAGVLDKLGAGERGGGLRPQRETVGEGPESKVRVMEVPGLAISSSIIRERLADGRPITYLVPDPVAQLIAKSGMYRPRPED
jgi:nicotinate-nucleotide adenylyltransferase